METESPGDVNTILSVITKQVIELRTEQLTFISCKSQLLLTYLQFKDEISNIQEILVFLKKKLGNKPCISKISPKIGAFVSPKIREIIYDLKYLLNIAELMCSISVSPNGKFLSFATMSSVLLYDYNNGILVKTVPMPKYQWSFGDNVIRKVHFSPDSSLLAICPPCNQIFVFKTSSLDLVSVLSGFVSFITSVSFFQDSKRLISSGLDGSICIWNLETAKIQKKFLFNDTHTKEPKMITDMKMSLDDRLIIIGFVDGTVKCIDMNETVLFNFQAHSCQILSVDISPNNQMIATSASECIAKVWNIQSVNEGINLSGHSDLVPTITFSNESDLVFTGSKDESIKCWDATNGIMYISISYHENTVFQVCHHPFNRSFATCSGDGCISIWDYRIRI